MALVPCEGQDGWVEPAWRIRARRETGSRILSHGRPGFVSPGTEAVDVN